MGKSRSQRVREASAQADSLRLGMGWPEADLEKPQVLVNSSAGEAHPGSIHLDGLAAAARAGVFEAGGRPIRTTVSDICDGVAQGHEGMNYSLPFREAMAQIVETQAESQQVDSLLLISSCDKSIPAHLLAAARMNLPTVCMPGGSMDPGPGGIIQGDVPEQFFRMKDGAISPEEFRRVSKDAAPGCGACQFMGTASTMQVLTEALGLALPGSALMPANSDAIVRMAHAAGRQAMAVGEAGLRARDILTEAALENAIMVHAAIGGSSNAALHIPALARELGIRLDAHRFDLLHRKVPYLADIMPSGSYPAQYLWYAGGAPQVMRALRDLLHLDAMTVTGKTLGENLDEWETAGGFDRQIGSLKDYGIEREQVIRPLDRPIHQEGSLAVLTGSLAPEGAVVKHSALDPKMRAFRGAARVFDSEEAALAAVTGGSIGPGTAVIVRYEGPRACGMPELYLLSRAIGCRPDLNAGSALITDGRFSGATSGPAIGHVSPEAQRGGPIALVEDDDLIEIDLEQRRLDIVGVGGKRLAEDEVARLLAERKAAWTAPAPRYATGILSLYTRLAVSAMRGAYMEAMDR